MGNVESMKEKEENPDLRLLLTIAEGNEVVPRPQFRPMELII